MTQAEFALLSPLEQNAAIWAVLGGLRTVDVVTKVATYYDATGSAVVLTLTPTEADGIITVTPQ